MADNAHTSDGHDEHADDGAVHVHVHSVGFYAMIFGALVALTVITVLTSYIDIDGFITPGTPHGAGGFNLALAMLIATAKASLVVTFFMHLREDARFNALLFLGSVLFAGVFLAYTMNDTAHRGEGDPFHGVHVLPTTGERAPGGVVCRFAGEEPESAIGHSVICVQDGIDIVPCEVGEEDLTCTSRNHSTIHLPLSRLPSTGHGGGHEEGHAEHGDEGAAHEGGSEEAHEGHE